MGRATACAFVVSSSSTASLSRSTKVVVGRLGFCSTTALSGTQYLLKYDYIPDVLEKRGPYREGHLNLAKKLIAEGTCLSGGPTGPLAMEVPTGALFIFTDQEAAKLFVEEDPYVANGIVTGHTIQEWNVVVQKE
jgi:uncharacterized protein